MFAKLPVWLLVSCVLACGVLRAQEKPSGDEIVVFQRPVDSGRDLAVVRGPLLDPNKMKGLLGALTLDQAAGIYNVRVEIRSGGKAIVLSTRLACGWKSEHEQDFDVIGFLLEPNHIVLATAEYAGISIWDINLLNSATSLDTIKGAEWSRHNAAFAVNRRNTSVTMSRSADAKALTVEVRELDAPESNRHTIYEQTGDDWKFRMVKSFLVPVDKKESVPEK